MTQVGGAVVTDVVYDEYETTGVASDDPCLVTMSFQHDAGCPMVDLYRVKLIFMENEWIVGIILLVFGSFIGLVGLKFLRVTAAAVISIGVILTTLIFSSIFGFFDTTLGMVLTICVALTVAVIFGLLTVFFVWVSMGCIGVLGGFFAGSFVYEATIMQFDFSHAWGFMTMTISGVILGLILVVKYGEQFILLSTSLIGGYLVMQGTSRFFPNQFPTEMQVVRAFESSEADWEFDWRFWLYIVQWIVFFLFFAAF